jgi:hypothetical protein
MEIWKSIPNYEGLYEVSSLGSVKSLGSDKTRKERILKQAIVKNQNRYYVGLCKNNIKKKYKVHQLVAMAFLNHTPCGYKVVVDHINNDSTDNRLENLQLITQRENAYKTQGKYSSKYKGVCWHKNSKKWRARIHFNGKNITIGYFKCELAASVAYQNKLKELC